jgi:ribokinase
MAKWQKRIMFDVITMGSAVCDVFINSTGTEIIRLKHPRENTEHVAFPTGSKILIDHANFDIGGGATNTGTSFSRLGFKTGAICNVGRDNYGEQIIASLRSEKIKFLGKVCHEHTDFSIVLDSKGHDRTLLAYKGASNTITTSQIKPKDLQCRWLYISTLMEGSFKTGVSVSTLARKKGIEVAFNPSTYLAKKGYTYLKKILQNTNLLVLNLEEASLLTKKKDVKEMLRLLSSYGPQIVVITDGQNGAYAYRNGITYFVLPRRDVKIVETTGAGDAFASSFLAGIMKTDDMKFALELGATNAESVIRYFGAHNKLLSWREAVTQMNKRPHKIKVFKSV